jgi:RNA polymerase sigma-70 factor (ECF subfamily)
MPVEQARFDQDYVRRLTEGDASIERHFTAYFGELLLIKLRRRLRSRHAIDDVRQETFLRVLERLRKKGGIEFPDRLGGFVNSVCNNVLLEWFRGDKRNILMDGGFDAPDRTINLEGGLVDQERKKLVQSVLAELSTNDHKILKMLFLDEIDKDDICKEMAVDRNYLRVLVHRARIRFKAVLTKSERKTRLPIA